MGTQKLCRLCGNDWGGRRISWQERNVLLTVYVCEVCGQGKTDYDIFKLICLNRDEKFVYLKCIEREA